MTSVPPDVVRMLHDHGGLARRRDLRAAGLSRRGLSRLLVDRELRALPRDVVSARVDVPGDEAVRAAAVGLRAVVSHSSAARLLGIELLREGPVEVTVARDRSRASWPGAVVHRRAVRPDEVVVHDGVRSTSPLRTVLDLARSLPLEQAVAAADSALRQGLVGLDELVQAAHEVPVARGSARVRRVVELVDPTSGSVLESVCRVLFVLAGLPSPVTQLLVRGRDGQVVGRVDFAWPEHRLVVETDGFAFHANRGSYRTDRRRSNALVLAGWRVLRFTWEDVVHQPDHVVALVRAALAA